jgi:hypothetical protein
MYVRWLTRVQLFSSKKFKEEKMRKALSVVVVAFVVGVVHTFIKPHLDNVVPASWKTNYWTQSFFTGAFIMVAVILSTSVIRMLPIPAVKGKVV